MTLRILLVMDPFIPVPPEVATRLRAVPGILAVTSVSL